MQNIELLKGEKLPCKLNDKIKFFSEMFKKDATFRLRRLNSRKAFPFDSAIIFFDGMVDSEKQNSGLIRPLLSLSVDNISGSVSKYLEKQVLFNNEVSSTDDIYKMVSALYLGDTVILLENTENALIVNTKGWRARGISEPQDERVLQGPREGFDEALMLNTALIRRKLSTPDLCFEALTVGTKTQTNIFICYLSSVADEKLVSMVKNKINSINIDGVLDANYVNELINDNKFSLFKTAGSTERPDIVAARLLEGRIAVMVDGTPVVLTLPYLFVENFQSDDDYYLNYVYSALGRIIRYVCYHLSVFLPAVYLALTLFHANLLPADFYSSVSVARQGVPFSSAIECLILIFIFEILRETGIRMQQSVGHALSIVGGLVVGQAAVEASLISAPLLIVVALSGIAGLTVPRLKAAVIYSKVFLAVLAALFGFFGVFAGAAILRFHLYSLDSFSVDYLCTVSEFSKSSLKDTAVRAPWWKMLKRPFVLSKNNYRQRNKYD